MVLRLALIEGIEKTIYDPVINNVVDDLIKRIIKDETVYKYLEYIYSKESVTVADDVKDNSIGGSTIDINAAIIDNEDLTTSLSVYKPINKPIFKDDDINLQVIPQYISTDIELSIKYRGQSKTTLNNVLNRLKTLFNNTPYIFKHDLEYSYIIPSNILSLIDNIITLKDDTIDIYTYLQSIALYRYDLAETRDKRYKTPVFRGNYLGVIGTFSDIPSSLTVEKENNTEYSISFTYSFTIQVPTALAIRYPILVNNKLIDEKWIPAKERALMMDTDINPRNALNVIDILVNDPNSNIDRICKVPTYDLWNPYIVNETPGKVRFLSILLTIDPDNLNNVFNINDLTTLGLDSKIVEYMLNTTDNDLLVFGNSIFYIELYETDYIRDLKLSIDTDKNIITEIPLDTTKTYHIVISILTDVNYIKDITDVELDMFKYLKVNPTNAKGPISFIKTDSR